MGRIVERIRAVPPGQAALAVAVIALVTAFVYFGGREAGVVERSEAGTAVAQDQRGEAAQQDDGEETDGEGDAGPLTLTLSAPEICETTPAQGYSGAAMVWNEETQDWGVKSYKTGYDDVGETAVTWSVGGGTAPYTLVIDGEKRDAEQTYAGPSGTASVSCAMQLGETFITDDGSRRHRTEPEVDSGLKTIRATVTDGAGATAEASVDVYVILRIAGSGRILESGKTYRVHRFLVTVPDGMTLVTGTKITEEDGPWIALDVVGAERQTWIWLATATGEDGGRYFFHPSRGHVKTDGSWYRTYDDLAKGLEPERMEVSDEIRRIDALFDELVESINRVPAVERAD